MNQVQQQAWMFDPQTHYYLGEVKLQPDPLNPGTYFGRNDVVMFAPPAVPEGMTVKIKEVDGLWKWEAVPDPSYPEPPTVEELRESALKSVEWWYLAARDSGFEWEGHKFQSDSPSREALLTCHAAGKGTSLGFWRDVDNNNVPNGSAEMVQKLVEAMLARGENLFVIRAKLRAFVKSASIEDLTNFDPAVMAKSL